MEERTLVGYSPWGRKESDMTEQLHFLFVNIGVKSPFAIPFSILLNVETSIEGRGVGRKKQGLPRAEGESIPLRSKEVG